MAAQAGKDISGQNPFSCADTIEGEGGQRWKQLGGKIYPSTDVLLHNSDFNLDLSLQSSYGKENSGQFNCLKRMCLTSCNLCLSRPNVALVLWANPAVLKSHT